MDNINSAKCFRAGLTEGEFKDGKPEGRGTYRFANGNVYEGEFKDGNPEGRGTMRKANGDIKDVRF